MNHPTIEEACEVVVAITNELAERCERYEYVIHNYRKACDNIMLKNDEDPFGGTWCAAYELIKSARQE